LRTPSTGIEYLDGESARTTGPLMIGNFPIFAYTSSPSRKGKVGVTEDEQNFGEHL